MPTRKNSAQHSDAQIAALAQQVAGIENDNRNIRADITGLQGRIESGLSAIANKIEERAKPQWSVYFMGLGLVFSVLTIIGGLAYWPINSSVTELKANDLLFRQLFVRNDVFLQYDRTMTALLDRHNDATAVLRGGIEQLRRELGAIAPPSSTLEELRKRLDRLEGRLINNKANEQH